MTMKQMLIHVKEDKLQAAVLRDGKLVDFHMEKSAGTGLVGTVHKGRIVNVLPGMQAAFVDIGLEKNAFLYVDDLLHPHLEKQPAQKPAIQELAKVGQELIVQIVREAQGGKGARVTTHYNLAGRWLVYMPIADYVGVSRKVSTDQERERLKLIGERLRLHEEGIILRTAAEGESETALEQDAAKLRELWQAITAHADHASAPVLLHSEAGLLQRVARDLLTPEIDEIWIDRSSKYDEMQVLLLEMVPKLYDRLRLYDKSSAMTIFEHFSVTDQIKSDFGRRIPIACGGYLIWEETEALTVIDVNSGSFTGTDTVEDTLFHVNMEAAALIARLLRVRDVGGLVIVDFIDMELEEHKQRVLQCMLDEARTDGKKCTIVGWTRLGLMELTRKKAGKNAFHQLSEICETCGGSGKQRVL